MTGAAPAQSFPYDFVFAFAGIWLLVTTFLGGMSGWFSLQQKYPDDGSERPLIKLGWQSGLMGANVVLRRVLKLRAYPSGLGIGIWRLFGPFQRPLKIPWSEIEAHESSGFLLPVIKLQLGRPARGTLKISPQSWARLLDALPQSGDHGFEALMVAARIANISRSETFES